MSTFLPINSPPVSLSSKEGPNLLGICPGLRFCLLLSEKSSIVTPEHSLLAMPSFAALAWRPIAVVAMRKAVVHGSFIEHKCQFSLCFEIWTSPTLLIEKSHYFLIALDILILHSKWVTINRINLLLLEPFYQVADCWSGMFFLATFLLKFC